MTTTSATLGALLLAGLTTTPTTTLAGARVFPRRDWPTQTTDYPCIILRFMREEKTSLSKGRLNFNVDAHWAINARVQVPAAADDAGAVVAEQQLQTLARQIELAVINYPPLMMLLQQIKSVSSEYDVKSDSEFHQGEVGMLFDLEFFQGVEDFFPVPQTRFEQATFTIPFPTQSAPGVPGPNVGFSLTLSPPS